MPTKTLLSILLGMALLFAAPIAAQENPAHDYAHEEEHAPGHEGEDDHSHHEGELAGVRTVHAWIRATDADTGLVFVDIENNSDKDIVLLGGETEIAASVTLVGFRLKDGKAVYEALPEMPVKAGTELVLAPNGLALQLDGITEDLHEGEEIEMEFEFDVGHIDMFVQVEAANATQHSHAGHQH